MRFKNLEYLLIQAGYSCVSNCSGCIRQYGKEIKFFSKIIDNLEIIKLRKIFNKKIFIYNIDYFSFSIPEIESILEYRDFFEKILFHTNFRNIQKEKIFDNIEFIYQRDWSLIEFKFLLNFLENKNLNNNKINFIYWCDNFDNIINLFKIFKYKGINIKKYTNSGGTIYFEIENKIFKFNLKKGERYGLKKCFFYNSISLEKGIINFSDFYISCLEVLIDGDIRAHEPPCGFGNIKITNINRDFDLLYEDFNNFSFYINDVNKNINQEKNCFYCQKKEFNYKKYENIGNN